MNWPSSILKRSPTISPLMIIAFERKPFERTLSMADRLQRKLPAVLLSLFLFAGTLQAQTPYRDPDFHYKRSAPDLVRPGVSLKEKNHVYKCTIIYKNDSVVTARGEWNRHTFPISIIVKHKKDMYLVFPSQTKELTANNMTAITTDSCWLFRIQKGRINAYSFYPDKKGDIAAVQKGKDGKIMPFSFLTMSELVADHRKAREFVKNGELYRALLHYND